MTVLVSESDSIPTKKIVAVIGNVSARKLAWVSEVKNSCIEDLKRQADDMGANAIINVTYEKAGILGWHGTARGLAVKVEEETK